MKRFVFENM